jgi:hypothetical protein
MRRRYRSCRPGCRRGTAIADRPLPATPYGPAQRSSATAGWGRYRQNAGVGHFQIQAQVPSLRRPLWVIFDRFSVALRYPLIPQKRASGPLAFMSTRPNVQQLLKQLQFLRIRTQPPWPRDSSGIRQSGYAGMAKKLECSDACGSGNAPVDRPRFRCRVQGGVATIRRTEVVDGKIPVTLANEAAIRHAFEIAGIEDNESGEDTRFRKKRK